MKKKFGQKKIVCQKYWSKKICQENFQLKKIPYRKKCQLKINLGQKFQSKKSSVKKTLIKKFLIKKIFGKKKCWSKKIRPKKISKKQFGPKKFLVSVGQQRLNHHGWDQCKDKGVVDSSGHPQLRNANSVLNNRPSTQVRRLLSLEEPFMFAWLVLQSATWRWELPCLVTWLVKPCLHLAVWNPNCQSVKAMVYTSNTSKWGSRFVGQ